MQEMHCSECRCRVIRLWVGLHRVLRSCWVCPLCRTVFPLCPPRFVCVVLSLVPAISLRCLLCCSPFSGCKPTLAYSQMKNVGYSKTKELYESFSSAVSSQQRGTGVAIYKARLKHEEMPRWISNHQRPYRPQQTTACQDCGWIPCRLLGLCLTDRQFIAVLDTFVHMQPFHSTFVGESCHELKCTQVQKHDLLFQDRLLSSSFNFGVLFCDQHREVRRRREKLASM
ncbi:hypothetical protein V1525DRAFT_52425 [Lipomyces kononenkoae]|uniref:Uncharacterized protein n=1 Tax=Lipomyces kononenkoae TaxID=34357 RepID=A0ACC3SSD6_LIPKO